MSAADIEQAKQCAAGYRRLGLVPLPSRSDFKAPAMKEYACYFSNMPVMQSVYDDWRASNIQLICGTRNPGLTRIVVVDCDGDEAIQKWKAVCKHHSYASTSTWICRTGGGGLHAYYSIPLALDECPSGILWGLWDTWGEDGSGKWSKHKEVRLIADGGLVVAPPSKHVESGKPYVWLKGRDPNTIPYPERAPEWLLTMPRLKKPSFVQEQRPTYKPMRRYMGDGHYDRDSVLQAIGSQKLDLVKSWGLVMASNPTPKGWSACYVPGRETPGQSTPSGSFNIYDGTLIDHKDEGAISFFDVAVSLGAYADWMSARDDLGEKFLGKLRG